MAEAAALYAGCKADEVVEEVECAVVAGAGLVFDSLAEANEWLYENRGAIAVGTVVVVGAVAMVVVAGPAGGLVLVAI